VNRNSRVRHPGAIPGWGPAPGWGQPLPGWTPLVDHSPLPVRMAGSVARWWWPTLTLAGFGVVAGFIVGHDHPGPGLSTQGLVTIALAAVVVVVLTFHRSAGPWPLARAVAEYAVVALLAGLLALAGAGDQPPTGPTAPAAKAEHAAKPKADAGENHRPGVLRVAAGVARAVTSGIRAVTGAARWVADLWRQADAKADHPSRPSTTTTPKEEAMALSPAAPPSTRRPL
jgi:hypothetical protein